MAYLDLLINTATTRRFTPGVIDAYGNPTKTWANFLVDTPCRWSTPNNREVKIGAEVVLADLQLFLGDVDTTAQDRVVLNGLTYEVLSAAQRQDGWGGHHIEAFLRVVK